MGKHWGNMGKHAKTWESIGGQSFISGKHGKTLGKHRENMGKHQENTRKQLKYWEILNDKVLVRENTGKHWENTGKHWENTEKQ